MKNRVRFTLIELITVIAIISILVAILLPTLSSVREKARKTQAKAEMNSIITAIKSYESTYGVLPVPENWDNADTGTEYDNLMALLTDVIKTGGDSDYENTRHIRFLDVPDQYTTNGYLNPWDGKYEIYMDTDYNDELTGPDGTLYGTVFITTTDGNNETVYSWK
ncbi:MAG TPA: type II secretion system protein [Victivallales bacterium]|nr:type II secretion system protein [Victivallales bacterium]